jgi:wyosine [tRNA(Phe)-imidazoG37] synthetase (radical SAM superfamily)
MLSNIVGFHIEPTNICTLKCPGCARTRFINQWPQHWRNHSINIDQLHHFLNIDLNGKTITLCGNYGDPIYHPEFHQLINGLKQRGTKLVIVTNGSYKSADWWESTVALLDHNDHVVFSVDGTPKNFTQYRINADWSTIHSAMKICAQAICQTTWKYIPFAYNETHIESAKNLSEEIGIDYFHVDPSDRFDDQTKHYQPIADYLGMRYQSQQAWKLHHAQTIVPQCNDHESHYISADGYYSPCCYVADHRFYYKTEFGKNRKSYQIANQTLTEILTQPTVVEFYDDLTSQPVCQYNCPAT